MIMRILTVLIVFLTACATKQETLPPLQAEGLRQMRQSHQNCEQEVKSMNVAPDVGAKFHANCMREKGYIVQ